ncbi:NUDIX domain-containing protein [Streptosporangium amethystogenes]|uniref:NUDIX domain-containing protein n=1 Tax=Streptosporangium amethystogenes TaxID=2002 RepID=UPI00379E2F99
MAITAGHIRAVIGDYLDALDRWLLPGGHLEVSDATLLDAALRELAEETGIPATAVTPAGERPLHIDIHPIPANPAKGEPGHRHIDFRFLLLYAIALT